MPACSAYKCRQREREVGITFHKYPKEEILRQKWVDATRRINYTPSKSAVLCSRHFKEEDIDRTSICTVRIRDGRIPTIFHHFPPPAQMKATKKCRVDLPTTDDEMDTNTIKCDDELETNTVVKCEANSESSSVSLVKASSSEYLSKSRKTNSPEFREKSKLLSSHVKQESSLSPERINSPSSSEGINSPSSPYGINSPSSPEGIDSPSSPEGFLSSSPPESMDSSYLFEIVHSPFTTENSKHSKVSSVEDNASLLGEKFKLERKLKICQQQLEDSRKKVRCLTHSRRRLSDRNDQLKKLVFALRQTIKSGVNNDLDLPICHSCPIDKP